MVKITNGMDLFKVRPHTKSGGGQSTSGLVSYPDPIAAADGLHHRYASVQISVQLLHIPVRLATNVTWIAVKLIRGDTTITMLRFVLFLDSSSNTHGRTPYRMVKRILFSATST